MTKALTPAPWNKPHLPTLVEAAYSQARAAMSLSMNVRLTWLRTGMSGLRVGALGLLLYTASFYTRDWRSVVPHLDQPAAAQAASRSKTEPRPVPGNFAEPPAPFEPATTGALTGIAPPVAAPSAGEAVSRPLASAPSRLQARPAAPPSALQHKLNKRTQVAARPVEASPVRLPPPAVETPIQFQLADRGGTS